MIRINKYLAQCGVASRRTADAMVVERRVTVNGKVADVPGFLVDENTDVVLVDGMVVKPAERGVYIVLNKPAGYLTSLSDPHHRQTVNLLLKELPHRVYPVGRLDLDTEGTLLFTNDGELAHRLAHPKYLILRVYQAQVQGRVIPDELTVLAKGVMLPDGGVGKAKAFLKEAGDESSILSLELREGRKREVKHLCKAIGHPVIKLVRLSFAGIDSSGLSAGQWRYLTEQEIDGLRHLVGLAS